MSAEESRNALLESADRLFYAHGIAGVAMSDVRDASGVSLRRLYQTFPSKRDLVAAWLDDRHLRWMRWFADTVERLIANGTHPIVAPIDAVLEWAQSPGFRGCAFLNALGEPAEIDDGHRQIVAAHKRALIEHVGTLVRAGGYDQPWLPAAIAVLVDGAIVQSAALASTAPITAARSAATGIMAGLS
jgi:AcrR family transcriptional regulator